MQIYKATITLHPQQAINIMAMLLYFTSLSLHSPGLIQESTRMWLLQNNTEGVTKYQLFSSILIVLLFINSIGVFNQGGWGCLQKMNILNVINMNLDRV